ncbi:Hypothetical predicted protein [Pelobates cultripes]|uniref:Uncharacterized protein n=1 Tax=Pelobates cultripes TaxID=61616 RepID=A0AAD1RGY5_PELCU|nr:Hypothetical predicted protein [Pelobates cultripes]
MEGSGEYGGSEREVTSSPVSRWARPKSDSAIQSSSSILQESEPSEAGLGTKILTIAVRRRSGRVPGVKFQDLGLIPKMPVQIPQDSVRLQVRFLRPRPSLLSGQDVTSDTLTTCQGRQGDARTFLRDAYVMYVCTAARTSQAPKSKVMPD